MVTDGLHRQHRREHGRVQRVAPRVGGVGQRVGAGVAGVEARRRHVDDGVQVMGEQPANFAEAGRVGGVADDRVHVKFLGGDLEVAATGTYQGYLVTVIAEALGYYAPQIGVAAGDQDLHCHDLLVFDVEPRPWQFTGPLPGISACYGVNPR